MIKTILKLSVDAKKGHMLNIPFHILLKDSTLSNHGRVSSYHQRESNEADWKINHDLPSDTKIIIAELPTGYSKNDILLFIAQNNGFGMSRNNLFAMEQMFREEIKKMVEAYENECTIFGFAPDDTLPTHDDGRQIYPMLTVGYKKDKVPFERVQQADYDWCWMELDNPPPTHVAFFSKEMHKDYSNR